MKTHFHRIDVNNDGVLTHDDYLLMVDRYTKTGKVDDAQTKMMGEMLTRVRPATRLLLISSDHEINPLLCSAYSVPHGVCKKLQLYIGVLPLVS